LEVEEITVKGKKEKADTPLEKQALPGIYLP